MQHGLSSSRESKAGHNKLEVLERINCVEHIYNQLLTSNVEAHYIVLELISLITVMGNCKTKMIEIIKRTERERASTSS